MPSKYFYSTEPGKLNTGRSTSPALKVETISTLPFDLANTQSSNTFSLPVLLTSDITYDDPGSIFTMPLSITLQKPVPSNIPALLIPNSVLIVEGVVAAPFLYDPTSLHNLSLSAYGDRTFHLKAGTQVATLIFLSPPTNDTPGVFSLHQPIHTSKSFLTVSLQGRSFSGLIDTGADVSVIRTAEWPPDWPLTNTSAVQGVGGAQAAKVSTNWLSASTPDSSATAFLKPYVLPLHCNLWGRDLLSQLQASLHIP